MGTRGFVGYKYKGKILGWYNHFDSYPQGLGAQVLAKFKMHTQEELKDFFLKKVTLSDEEEDYGSHKSIMDADWLDGTYTLKDGGDFYKDGLFCEYSYIFNLGAKDKQLLLYKGFGKKPCKGIEDWFYGSPSDTERHYINDCGSMMSNEANFLIMISRFGNKYVNLDEIIKMSDAELPALLGKPDVVDYITKEYKDDDYVISDLQEAIQDYINERIKE